MGKTFGKVHASSVGNFESNTSKIPQWITAHGGAYSKAVVDGVTHLVASRDAFTQNVPAVARAKELGNVKIVSYDWLADSLLQKSRTPKLVTHYLWVNILKREKENDRTGRSQKKKKKKKKKKGSVGMDQKVKGQAGGDDAELGQATKDKSAKLTSVKKRRKQRAKSTDPFDTKRRTPKARSIASGYRLHEADGVIFSAILVRPSIIARNNKETIQLKMYETVNNPRTYATHISFTRQGPSKTDFLAPLGSNYDTAMIAFKEFFKVQTGKEWEDRLNGLSPTPKKDENGNAKPPHKGWFWFDSSPVSSLASMFRTGEI